jgi:Arc/MetJ family transcription regulator
VKPAVALAWGLVVAVASAAAADEGRLQLEQRIRLSARLIADSPTAQRITASGNVQAVGHFDESRLHQSLAEEALQRGDLATARRAVDDALRHVGQARRLVPDLPGRQAAARLRQAQMHANLERLIQSWREHALLTGPGDVVDGDLAAALGLMGTARYFAEAGRYEESVFTLGTAEQHVLSGMKRALQSRELDYTARARNPSEEFQIELQRHAGLADLVPLAVNELKPRGEAAALIERYGDASRTLRAQAQQQFQGGDLPAALAHIRNATLYLQRALQAAGVAMPNPTGSTP